MELSQLLRGRIDKKKEIATDAYASTVDINQKLGKLECLLTDGQRGLPGAVLPCMEQAVDLYKNDHELYLLYRKAAKRNITLSQLKKRLANKEEKKAAAASIVEAAPVVDSSVIDAEKLQAAENVAAKVVEAEENTPVSVVTIPADETLPPSNVPAAEEESAPNDETVIIEESIPSDEVAVTEEITPEAVQEETEEPEYLLPIDTSVLELKLSNRLKNILMRNEITTIRGMLDYPRDQWMSLRNMGAKTFQEVLTILEKYKGANEQTLVPAQSPVDTDSEFNILNKELLFQSRLLMRENSIDDLPISIRLKNILHRNSLFTLGDVLDYPREQFAGMKGMGKSTLMELDQVLKFHQRPASLANISSFSVSYDTPIQKLDFGRGVSDVLQKNGFVNLRDALRYPTEKWYDLPGLRVSQVLELIDRMEVYRNRARATAERKRELENKDTPAEQLSKEAKGLIAFADMILVTYEYVMAVLHDKNEEKRTIAEKLWEEKKIQEAIKAWVLLWLKVKKYDGSSLFELSQKFPELVYDDGIFDKLLKEMEEEGLIRKQGDMIFRVYPSAVEYLSSLKDERARELIRLRLEGKSLEETAQKLGITRERVRQIQNKIFQDLSLVEEGYWLSTKERFSGLTEEDFEFVFQLPAETVHFLSLWGGGFPGPRKSTNKSTKESRIHELHHVLQDAETDEETYKRAQERIREISPYFLIDGKKIPQKRDALIRFAIKTYCQEQRTSKELKDYYDGLRQKLGKEATDPSFDIDLRYLEHYFASLNVLASGRKRMRYYDILANDYGELLDGLDFSAYANVIVSARKFFLDYPKLMEQYDIRSEGELHNLLKKLWDYGQYNQYVDESHQLTCEKMPMLRFGKADRARQIVQLLRENAPISYMDFGVLIENELGIPQNTALANWVQPVEEYLVNGTYIMNTSHLPMEELEHMRSILTEDFYLTAEIRDAYTEEFPEVNSWDIGIGAIRQMGFIPHGKYAVRSTYKNATDFFEQLFNKDDVVDLREKSEFLLSSSCTLVCRKMQENCQIAEVEPGVFYHARLLAERGVSQEAIADFRRAVYDFMNEEKCFTIYSLRRKGFVLPWAEGRWSDWFYASLLASDSEHFNCQRFGKVKLLRRRKMQRKLSFIDLLEEITDEASYMLTIDEIRQILRVKYGMDMNVTKIKEAAQSDDMFEDRILY